MPLEDLVGKPCIAVLERAIALDKERKYEEAILCYKNGIEELMNVLKGLNDENVRREMRRYISKYLERAEHIKNNLHLITKNDHEHVEIKDNDIGFDYDSIFGKFLTDQISHLYINDPYIRNFHQIQNLVRFIELIIKRSKNVKLIKLTTSKNSNPDKIHIQEKNLNIVKKNCHDMYDINLDITYSLTLHDRSIILSDGTTIKLGRGLDFFKPLPNSLAPGMYDLSVRPCYETSVDIYRN